MPKGSSFQARWAATESAGLAARTEALFADLETALGVAIAIHDLRSLLLLPDGRPVVSRPGHAGNPYCCLGREQGNPWDRRCMAHCFRDLRERCAAERRPFVARCWKGAVEVVIPFYRSDEHALTLFLGGFRDPNGLGAPCRETVGREPTPTLRAAYRRLRPLGEDDALRLARIVRQVMAGTLEAVERANAIEPDREDRSAIIRRFIAYHAHRAVRLEDLAEALHLSPSRAGHVVREECGASFQDLVTAERIRRAKHLLRNSRHNQEHIAERCGFGSPYYFNRLFSRIVGIPPGRYRRENRSAELGED